MNIKEQILDSITPDFISELTAQPENIIKAKRLTGALATLPVSVGALAGATYGAQNKLPKKIAEVLNFALTLEYLEDEFYRTALGSSGLIPSDTQDVFGQISKHEAAHVALLKSVLGSTAVSKPNFDFTAGGAFGDVFSNYQTFLAVSQAFEDTGVRAYKGQAGNLKGNGKILTTALQIHSVEARHAAEVRRLRGEKAWITNDSRGSLPAPTQPIYFAEGKTSEGGVVLEAKNINVSDDAISEAFDEPLSKSQVLAIASLFIKN